MKGFARVFREAERFRLEREAKRVGLIVFSFVDIGAILVAGAVLGYVLGQVVGMRGF
jgi:hypothetical protein